MPEGCYYLADAGFPLCDILMTPYISVWYHIKEWARGSQWFVLYTFLCYNTDEDLDRPCTYQELFNLHHAQARNVVERIFGIFKRKFRVFDRAPKYELAVQAMLVPATLGLHNYRRKHTPDNEVTTEAGDDGANTQHQQDTSPRVNGNPAFTITQDEANRAEQ